MADIDERKIAKSNRGCVVGIVTLYERPATEAFLKSRYDDHLLQGRKLSKIIFFQCAPPVDYNEETDHEVQFVDIGTDGLALTSSSGTKVTSKDWQYLSLIMALAEVEDLMIYYPNDINVSTLDMWFNAAHDAGVEKYVLENPLSGSLVRSQTSQLHLVNISKRLKWLGGNIEVHTSETQSALEVGTLGDLRPKIGNLLEDRDRKLYRQELKRKLELLRDLQTRLLKAKRKRRNVFDDEQLHHLNLAIQRLGSRRNALAPIFRLPPELLCHIFTFTSCNAETYGKYPPSLAWVKVSHVCGHWREVSQNTPSIWSNIPAFVLQWTEEMLKRSKSSLLRVHYNEEEDVHLDHPDRSALESALEHLDRIVDLSISTNSAYLDISLANPAPILERFSLMMHNGPRGAPIVPIIHLFSGIAPRLRHMSLGGACFDFKSALLQNLTSLELSNIGVRAHGVNPTEILINLFAGMPKLKELNLCDALPRIDPRNFPQREHRTNLPALVALHITESLLPNILDFLTRIIIANEARGIPLRLGFGVNSNRDLSLLFTEIERLSRLKDRPFRSVRISRGSDFDRGLLIEGWNSIDGPINSTSAPDLFLDLRLGNSDHTTFANALRRVIFTLPFSRTLLVAVHNIDLKSAWRSVIKQLQNVHTVLLDGCPPAPLLACLHHECHQVQSTKSALDQNLHFLPDLRILLFRRVFFGNKMKNLATLAKVLLHRQQMHKSAIIQLQFDRCRGMSEAHALVFQKIVPNVAWTEIESAESDEEYDEDSQSDN